LSIAFCIRKRQEIARFRVFLFGMCSGILAEIPKRFAKNSVGLLRRNTQEAKRTGRRENL